MIKNIKLLVQILKLNLLENTAEIIFMIKLKQIIYLDNYIIIIIGYHIMEWICLFMII